MKTRIPALALIVFFALTSCFGLNAKKRSSAETDRLAVCAGDPDDRAGSAGQPDETSEADSVFTSKIRPGEELRAGEIHTDDFEYVGFNDDGDYWFFIVKKEGARIDLTDGCAEGAVPELNRGDMIEVEWKIDSTWVAGDGDALYMTEFAVKIRKTMDGRMSLFRKQRSEPLRYNFDDGSEYDEWDLERINREVEYYLANSRKEWVREIADNPDAVISYSVSDVEWDDDKTALAIELFEETGGSADTFHWIYLVDEHYLYMNIYEYDDGIDALAKFE